jgi:hypothetical protein
VITKKASHPPRYRSILSFQRLILANNIPNIDLRKNKQTRESENMRGKVLRYTFPSHIRRRAVVPRRRDSRDCRILYVARVHSAERRVLTEERSRSVGSSYELKRARDETLRSRSCERHNNASVLEIKLEIGNYAR